MQDLIQWCWGEAWDSTCFTSSQVLDPAHPRAALPASITWAGASGASSGSIPDLKNQNLHFYKLQVIHITLKFERHWSRAVVLTQLQSGIIWSIILRLQSWTTPIRSNWGSKVDSPHRCFRASSVVVLGHSHDWELLSPVGISHTTPGQEVRLQT